MALAVVFDMQRTAELRAADFSLENTFQAANCQLRDSERESEGHQRHQIKGVIVHLIRTRMHNSKDNGIIQHLTQR